MNGLKKNDIHISYSTSFFQLGEFNHQTKRIWVVCHGYGQLVKYFSRRFDAIKSEEDLILFPEALSQFYLDQEYKNVGSSWMTKENRLRDIENIHSYLNSMLRSISSLKEIQKRNISINLLGFSQGATTVSRWAFAEKIPFDNLILWGGNTPHEMEEYDFSFLKTNAKILSVIGKIDPFFKDKRDEKLIDYLKSTFGEDRYSNLYYNGGHQIIRETLSEVKSLIEKERLLNS
ncbi:alpha/beta hydrolase [Sediminitomix flava]|uniref:Putative esterase n=1 Tax=Sediminitomix flava TaxID=379075 RepID=A0A315Z8J8_SEDFL|nr:hypothetical protein [Sediminitomix flava]PWJ40020.1 putative esterase [Sediminitomix flava]